MSQSIDAVRSSYVQDIEPELQKKELTAKEHKFIQLYIDNGNATEAALEVYKCGTRASARVMASKVLAKVNVKGMFAISAQKSALRIERLAEHAKSEKVQLDANRDILDRAGYKARDNVHVEHTFSLLGLAEKRQMLDGNANTVVIEPKPEGIE